MGEGYRYLLLTIITVAVLFTSTVLVLTAASQPKVAATVSGPVATAMPATTSSQKWFAVAITQNQTHTGQTAQSAFDHQRLPDEKR